MRHDWLSRWIRVLDSRTLDAGAQRAPHRRIPQQTDPVSSPGGFHIPLLLTIVLVLTSWSCRAAPPTSTPQDLATTPESGAVAASSADSAPEPTAPEGPSPAVTPASDSTPETASETVAETVPGPPLYWTDEQGVAIQGSDPVAYFTQGAPTPGFPEFYLEWGGVTWWFSSLDHRTLFEANPEAYAPQYGGYCAWAVSQGYLAPIDPAVWSIVDDRLYLNFDSGIQRRWERDIPGFIRQADANWPQVLFN